MIKQNKIGPLKALFLILLGLTILSVCIAILLQGTNFTSLNAKGLIAREQRTLLLFTISVILIVALPTVLLLYFMAWRYRSSNLKIAHKPQARQGKLFVFSIWAIPSIFMLIIAVVLVPATHRLEPRKQLDSQTKPMTIQVVSLRWKWVFIYPEQNIATVNFVNMPLNTPVTFELTADESPMSSFWIPNLGGQLYAMTGHVNRLNLMADTAGDYPGSSAELTGAGFSGMKFTARASTQEDFDSWVRSVKQSSDVLDTATYTSLVKPSENQPTIFYSSYDSDLYDKVVMKYTGAHAHQPAKYEAQH